MILLHKVQHGPASQSHGLQVAKLAGIPESVIKDAQHRLRILEKQQQPQVVQNDLFSNLQEAEVIEKVIEVEKSSPALDALKVLDLDDLTPRQALEQLYQLKQLLKA